MIKNMHTLAEIKRNENWLCSQVFDLLSYVRH